MIIKRNYYNFNKNYLKTTAEKKQNEQLKAIDLFLKDLKNR